MEAVAVVESLGKRLDERASVAARLDTYYRGRDRLPMVSARFREAFGGRFGELRVNLCGLVVDAVEERLDVVGFRLRGEDATLADAWAIWQANNLDAGAQLAHAEALVQGRAFALVWADDDGAPRVTVESARQVTVAYAAGSRRRVAALKRWVEDGRAYATVYLPDEVARFVSKARVSDASQQVPASGWVRRGPVLVNPLGVVPVVALVNRPGLFDPGCGESELRDVIPLQDAISKTLADMLVASEFSACQRRWATGLEIPVDPETNQAVEPFNAAVDRLWIAEDPEARFGSFPEADLSGYVAAVDAFVAQVAAVSRTPPHYLEVKGQFPSGEALKAAEAGLVAKVRRKMTYFGEAWEEVVRLALAVRDGGFRPDLAELETVWANPETRTEGEVADAAIKRQQVGVPWAQSMEDLGYTPTQIERMRTLRRQDAADTSQASAFAEVLAATAPREVAPDAVNA